MVRNLFSDLVLLFDGRADFERLTVNRMTDGSLSFQSRWRLNGLAKTVSISLPPQVLHHSCVWAMSHTFYSVVAVQCLAFCRPILDDLRLSTDSQSFEG